MAVLITDIYDSQAVAARRTQDPSNAMGFVGKAFFPNRKKLGLSLKWIKTSSIKLLHLPLERGLKF